jgi:hypothetical protein
VGWDWVQLLRRPLIGLLYQPRMTDGDECGAVYGFRIDKGYRRIRTEPEPVSLCPPQIPYDVTYARTRAAEVETLRLTAWAMARPLSGCFFIASGVRPSPLYCGHFWPIVPAPDNSWGWLCSNWWNEDWQGKPKYSEKTCPSATLSTTNPTWSSFALLQDKPPYYMLIDNVLEERDATDLKLQINVWVNLYFISRGVH